MDALLLILMFLSPLLVILLFQFLMKRSTGYDPRSQTERPFLFRRDDIDFLNLPQFDEPAQEQRKPKEITHYDALVDAEWAEVHTSRLEEPLAEVENDEVQSLSALLASEKQHESH